MQKENTKNNFEAIKTPFAYEIFKYTNNYTHKVSELLVHLNELDNSFNIDESSYKSILMNQLEFGGMFIFKSFASEEVFLDEISQGLAVKYRQFYLTSILGPQILSEDREEDLAKILDRIAIDTEDNYSGTKKVDVENFLNKLRVTFLQSEVLFTSEEPTEAHTKSAGISYVFDNKVLNKYLIDYIEYLSELDFFEVLKYSPNESGVL